MAFSAPISKSTGNLVAASDWNTNTVDNVNALLPLVLPFFIDGGGAVIATGIKGTLEVTMKCDLERVTMLADQTGSIVCDIWNQTYASYPPADAQSITASAVPTITSSNKSQDSSLTGWSPAIAAGAILFYNVDSCSTLEWCLVSLKASRS